MDTKRRIDMAKAFADLYLMLDAVRIWVAADVLCLWRCPHKVVKSLSIDFSRYKSFTYTRRPVVTSITPFSTRMSTQSRSHPCLLARWYGCLGRDDDLSFRLPSFLSGLPFLSRGHTYFADSMIYNDPFLSDRLSSKQDDSFGIVNDTEVNSDRQEGDLSGAVDRYITVLPQHPSAYHTEHSTVPAQPSLESQQLNTHRCAVMHCRFANAPLGPSDPGTTSSEGLTAPRLDTSSVSSSRTLAAPVQADRKTSGVGNDERSACIPELSTVDSFLSDSHNTSLSNTPGVNRLVRILSYAL
ncbi:unnamed protein product [Vitrella brassicaformis CCMP3155]|uniref:Uncharacterized protein n=1 Tax=Vitrella brassicaformis (strain CCMP3155) TaxID=1169540 RepID=A0A0G4GPV3_VITBC|nr:unnamed protein product [Vitrella brassicaformis CCMP3155]|eukprot:CEM32405.1 unnamed protein product [Vitrella brassicaformis CCMP3155]